jgi:uracil-DNA glycosylase family 4
MPPDPRAVESLLAFWTACGVDTLYGETPVDRTATPARSALARPVAPAAGLRRIDPPSQVRSRPVDAGLVGAGAASNDTGPSVEAVAEARRAADAAGDLAALKEAITAFDGCPLKNGARQAVFSRGRPDAPVMVIGEAPGADEDIQGAPFVGRAGQLLDRMFAAAGLSERVFITNTVFWRPPGNRTPTPAEQALCAPFLERAIALVAPRALLLVGGASAKAMLRRPEGILALRGRWFEWRSDDGALEVPALPTLHPAFLLRQPVAKRKSWEDLLILAERLDRPPRPD